MADTKLDAIFDKMVNIPEDFEMPDGLIDLLDWAHSVGVLNIVLDMIRDGYPWRSIHDYVDQQDQILGG
jgi:hypothetical protein